MLFTDLDLTEIFAFVMEQIEIGILWLQSHYLVIYEHRFSFYDLFFDSWAIVLIVQWIPVIGDMFGDPMDDDDDTQYYWYD